MKNILLAIFVLLAAQPVQAVSCDMHDQGQMGHTQQGAMHHGPMDESAQDMDCCDHDPETPSTGCTSMSNCGTGTSGLAAISPSLLSLDFGRVIQAPPWMPTTLVDGATSPPFKPPIA